MTHLVRIQRGAIVMDPTCGGGTFLVEALQAAEGPITLVGNDVDRMLVGLAELMLALAGALDVRLWAENLYDVTHAFELRGKVNVILANPPYSLELDRVSQESDLFRLGYHTSDAVFLDLARDLLAPGGDCVCLLPHSLVVNREFEPLRLAVERHWSIAGVITLPEGAFHKTSNTTTRTDVVHLKKKPARTPRSYFANAPTVGFALNGRDKGENDALGRIATGVRSGQGDDVQTASGSTKNGHAFLVLASQNDPGLWDPYRYQGTDKETLDRYLDVMSLPTLGRGHAPLRFAPIEYAHIHGTELPTFTLESPGAAVGLGCRAAPEERLLFGTMRAYLGNVIVTPEASWLGEQPPLVFPIKSEFVEVRPKDGLVYFWLAFLRSPGLLKLLPVGGGGTRPRLQSEQLLKTPIRAPSRAIRERLHLELRALAEQSWRSYMTTRRITSSLR